MFSPDKRWEGRFLPLLQIFLGVQLAFLKACARIDCDEVGSHDTSKSGKKGFSEAAKWLWVLSIAARGLAVSTLPEDPQRLFSEARLLQEKGDLQGAEDHYRQFLQLQPHSAEGHANLGIVLAHEDKLDAAVAEYETALRINPALYGINLNLGIAYYREADYAKAITPLRRFLSAHPAHSQARELLGLSYTQLDRYQEAIDTLAPLRPKGDPGVLYALAACYVRVRKMDEAQEVMRSLLTNEPDSPAFGF